MHMADALLSPTVGVGFLAASGSALAYSAKRIKEEADDRKIPLMGVLGAFVFSAQMINFTIPGTGSSGHIGGGMLLAMLLGPYAALITMASVLIIQALLFADGGILALGTNIWNMGFYPCFVGWWIYRAIVGRNPTYARLSIAAMVGILIALEMGALSVAVQTVLSGKSELPLEKFAILMLGIHFPIAVIEGVMMRSPNSITIAVRKKTGNIKVDKHNYHTLTQRYRWLNVPIVRGVVNLFEMMVLGTKAINFSANEQVYTEEEQKELEKKISQKI